MIYIPRWLIFFISLASYELRFTFTDSKWAHYVENLTATISLTSNFANEFNFKHVLVLLFDSSDSSLGRLRLSPNPETPLRLCTGTLHSVARAAPHGHPHGAPFSSSRLLASSPFPRLLFLVSSPLSRGRFADCEAAGRGR